MQLFITTLLLVFSLAGFAGERKYPVQSIPEKLLKGANVIKRLHEESFRIVNSGEAVHVKRFALTILNENGEGHAGFHTFYDKMSSVSSIEGALYDAQGNLLKKVKVKDILDRSAVSNISLMEDNRVKLHNFYYNSYPYTIEYELVQQYNYTMFFPEWTPQDDECFAVEQSSMTIICPEDYQVRFRSFNYPGDPVILTEKNMKQLKWSVKEIVAVDDPVASPSWRDFTTTVVFAPSRFEVGSYKGDMSTWKTFGQFMYALKSGRDELPPLVVLQVQQLTSNLTDVREKVAVLYRFMQKNTRYISIQLGLGSWQPFEAAIVAKNGYGDCKALSNYMYSLLKVAGIPSHYALVNGGTEPYYKERVIDDFPSSRFNHAILCVPLPKDSIWLECTSQTDPVGYMGNFTGNRKALLITEGGGVLVSTPRYGLQENQQLRKVVGRLDENGLLQADVHTVYSGIKQDAISGMIHNLAKEEIQKQLNRTFALGTYDVAKFDYREDHLTLPKVEERLTLAAINYASLSGKRLFIAPNVLNRTSSKFSFDSSRTVDYVFDLSWREEDRAEIELPAGFQLESSVKDVAIKNEFGSYNSTTQLVGNKLIYHRVREQYGGRFPAKSGKSLALFLESIYKADNSKIVLVRTTNP